jgi:hypothetical protein
LPVVFKASATCAATFSTALMAMSGPITRTRLEPVGNLHRAGGLGEALAVVPVVWKLWLPTRLWPGLCNELAVRGVRG